MKLVRRTTMLALILLATSATLASASSSLSGEYETTVKTAGELNGTYRISFSPGHFILHAPYGITGHGTYSISGSRITMHGPSAGCTSAGTYEFKISGSYLSFKKIHDACQRSEILTAHALKRT
jgi:hypothetical protein